MSEHARRPSTILGIAASAFAVAAVAIEPTYAIPGVLLGAAGIGYALLRRHRQILRLAVPLGLVSVLAHGAMGGRSFGTVAAAVLLVFAWDQADHAFDLDAQLGTDANVVRGELAHAAYSLVVAVLAAGGAYVLAFVAASRRPLPALVLLLLGALLLAAALRDR